MLLDRWANSAHRITVEAPRPPKDRDHLGGVPNCLRGRTVKWSRVVADDDEPSLDS
jgi:hypothetical protein